MGITFRRAEPQRGPVEILEDLSFAFTIDIYDADRPATIPAASVQIQKPGGDDLIAKESVTPSAGPEGSSNRLAYTLLAATNDTADEGFVLTWFATIGGQEYQHRVVFDVVKTQLVNPVREDDLFELLPMLAYERSTVVDGLADSGSTTTLIDEHLKEFPDDWFNGGALIILDGTNEGEGREVSDFARSTGTVTVGVAFSSAIDTTSRYRLRRSWEPLILRAFEHIRWRLRARGLRPALVIDSYELFWPTLYIAAALAIESIASLRGRGPDSDLWSTATEYRHRADETFNATKLNYDVGEDAMPDAVVEISAVRARRR